MFLYAFPSCFNRCCFVFENLERASCILFNNVVKYGCDYCNKGGAHVKKWLCLLLVGMLLVCCTACKATDKDTVPYNHVSAASLTDEQAQEIMAVIVPKQLEIMHIFGEWNDNTLDYTKVCPWDENYVLFTDERFTCVQDIKDFVLDVMTEETAEKEYFDKFLDGPYDPINHIANKYIDYDGKLYRSLYSGGKGYNYTLLPETSRIVARTENSVKIEMNTIYSMHTDDGWMYTPTLVKTNVGWRIHSMLHEGYFAN